MANLFCAPDDWSMFMTGHDIVHQTLPNNDYSAFCGSFEQEDTICSYLLTDHVASVDDHFNNSHSVYSFEDQCYPNSCDTANLVAEASLSYSCEADAAETSLSHHFGQSDTSYPHYIPSMDNDPNYPISISFAPADDMTTDPHQVRPHDIAQQVYHFPHNYAEKLDIAYFSLSPMVSLAGSHTYNCAEQNFDGASWKYLRSEHARPLFCIFHYAGCKLRFTSKNEWKRHILHQHLNLQYWVCTEGTCGLKERLINETYAPNMPARGSIFNRKDLYTQHVRRMHLVHDANPCDADAQGSKVRMRDLQAKAARTRCTLPDFMLCPVPDCVSEFGDSNAWDNWMEHVAAHMQRAASGEEVLIGFGGPENWTLTHWAASEAVAITHQTAAGTWTLCKPIHGRGNNLQSGRPTQQNEMVAHA